MAHVGIVAPRQFDETLLQRTVGLEDQPIGSLQRGDLRAIESRPLESHQIQPAHPRRTALGDEEGRRIQADASATAQHGVTTDATELMHDDIAGNESAFTNLCVPGQQRAVGDDDMIRDTVIMAGMRAAIIVIMAADDECAPRLQPRLMVTYSRNTLASPISSVVARPW